MRKLILKWLLKEQKLQEFLKDSKDYLNLLKENIKIRGEHMETLKNYGENLKQMKQLIDVCIKHGIDVDEELEV